MFLKCIHPLRYAITHLSFPEILHLGTWEFNLHSWLFFFFHFITLNFKTCSASLTKFLWLHRNIKDASLKDKINSKHFCTVLNDVLNNDLGITQKTKEVKHSYSQIINNINNKTILMK